MRNDFEKCKYFQNGSELVKCYQALTFHFPYFSNKDSVQVGILMQSFSKWDGIKSEFARDLAEVDINLKNDISIRAENLAKMVETFIEKPLRPDQK